MKRRFSQSAILWLVAVGLFVASFVARFMLADFPKGIGVLPDEIRYLGLASSLFDQGELILRGGYASFQKILYPLSLFPAFLADDPQARMRLVTALNCLYVSSSVFPALLLARRLFKQLAPVVICLAFTLAMPDMAYSMTFLSECVYLPLVLWLVWVAVESLDATGRRGALLALLAGFLSLLAYLAKEVALGFVLAYLAIMAWRIVRAKDKQERLALAKPLAAFVVAFALPFLVLKLTLFSGLLNSYNQADPSILLNPYVWLFAIYALASDAAHFAIAFMFFPLVVPAFTWRRLTRYERELYLFCVLSFLFILLAVVYTISIREDLGHAGVRPHVRYVAPIFLPLLFLTVKQLHRRDGASILRSPLVLGIALAATFSMGVLALCFLGTADYSQGFDYAQFHVARIVDEWVPELPVDPQAPDSDGIEEDDVYQGDPFVIDPGIWALKLVFCLYLAFGFWAYVSRNRSWPGIALLSCIAVTMLANYAGACLYHAGVYRVPQAEVNEMCQIDELVDAVASEGQVLLVYDEGSSRFNNLMDVYVDNDRLNCSYITIDAFKRVLEDEGSQKELLIRSDATMGDNIYGVNGRTNDESAGISYLVMSSANKRIQFDDAVVREVTPEQFTDARVFEVLSGADMRMLLPSAHSSTPR